MKQRITYFDAAKGIGMVCIIAGHLFISPLIRNTLFSFHVPLFFCISGWFFQAEKDTVKKYIMRCLPAYFFTTILLFVGDVFVNLLKYLIGRNSESIVAIGIKWLVAFAYGSGGRTNFFGLKPSGIGAIWFLLALVWAVLLQFIIEKSTQNINNHTLHEFVQILIVICLLNVSIITADYLWLPLSIQAGIAGLIFLFIGRKAKVLSGSFSVKASFCIVGGLVWGLDILYNIYNGNLSIVSCIFPNPVINIIGGVSAAYLIVCLCSIINNRGGIFYRWLVWFGNNSMIVLCFHLVELYFIPWGLLFGWCKNIIIMDSLILICKLLYCCICIKVVHRIKLVSYFFE